MFLWLDRGLNISLFVNWLTPAKKRRRRKPIKLSKLITWLPSRLTQFFLKASCHSDQKSVKKRYVTKTCEHKGEKTGFIACFVHQCDCWKKENPKKKRKDHPRRLLKERKFLKGECLNFAKFLLSCNSKGNVWPKTHYFVAQWSCFLTYLNLLNTVAWILIVFFLEMFSGSERIVNKTSTLFYNHPTSRVARK